MEREGDIKKEQDASNGIKKEQDASWTESDDTRLNEDHEKKNGETKSNIVENSSNGGCEGGGNMEVIKTEKMSKRQLKKAEKRRLWEMGKAERRKEQREKRKQKMEKRRQENPQEVSRSASRKQIKMQQVKMADSSCKVGVVFDMQFGDLMNERDLGKCLKQILRCYSSNRRMKAPFQMYMTSFTGKVAEQMNKHNGYKAWDMHFVPESFIERLDKESIVYLTSDSSNSLEKLEDGVNYIIGGLVDHNHHPGICLQKAEELGVKHARLPLDSFLEMKTRHVLTINHVYEILTKARTNSWRDAFISTLPKRKGVAPRDSNKDDSNEAKNGEVKKQWKKKKGQKKDEERMRKSMNWSLLVPEEEGTSESKVKI